MKSKLNKLWEKILASILVVMLMGGNLMIIGNSMVTYAGGTIDVQDEKTAHKNVEFGAYFVNEDEHTHEILCDAKEKTCIYVHLNVKESGHLKSGSIEIKDANYTIAGELEESEIIGAREENKLTLKQIGFGTDATIEIPVELKQEEIFNIENIDKESKVVLNGIYVSKEGKEIKIQKEVKLNAKWEETPSFEAESEVIGYIKTETSTIIREKITVKGNNKLPIQETSLTVRVPMLENSKPENAIVSSNRTKMTNGKEYEEVEINSEYDKEEGIVTIKTTNTEEDGKVKNTTNGVDEYIITYEYPEVINEEVGINREAEITVKNYAEKEEIETIKGEEILSEEIGTIVDSEIEISKINKAKMYANYNSNRREYETEYSIKEIVSNIKPDLTEETVIKDIEETFKDEEKNDYNTKIGEVNYTYYKTTKIGIDNFAEVLGDEGEIIIEDLNGEKIATINNSSKEEEGKYVVEYEENYGEIVLRISKQIKEGNLYIEHEKAIKADLGYSKEQAKLFREIVKRVEVDGKIVEKAVSIEEPENKITLEANKDIISKEEEDIEIRLELGNNNEESLLYVDPTIEIVLPEFVEEAEITNTNLLLEDELEIGKKQVKTNEDGKKVVEVKLNGVQTKFNEVTNGNGTTLVLGLKLKSIQAEDEGSIIAIIENSRAETQLRTNIIKVKESRETSEKEADEQNEIEEAKETGENIIQAAKETGENIIQAEGVKKDLKLKAEENTESNLDKNWYHTSAENEDFALGISVKKEKEKYRIGDVISYYVYLITYKENEAYREIINDLTISFNMSSVSAVTSIDRYVNGRVDRNTKDLIIANETEREVTWKLNTLFNYNDIKINTILQDVDKDGMIGGKATVKYLDKTIETEIEIPIATKELSVTAETQNVKATNQMGDTIDFIINIKNNSDTTAETEVEFDLPNELKMAKYVIGDGIEVKTTSQHYEDNNIVISGNSTYSIKFTVLVDEFYIDSEKEAQRLSAKGKADGKEFTWEILIANSNYGGQEIPTPTSQPTTEPTPEETSEQSEERTGQYSISGLAWLDENENGIKEVSEKLLKGIKVKLVNVDTGKVIEERQTDTNGNYTFIKLEKGKYQVIFNYDEAEYNLTAYLKTEKPEVNSSTIAGNSKGEATTDIITIEDEDVLHINIGLTKILVFDMKVEQTISKMIIQNPAEGTKEISYNNTYAKTDIKSKYINNTVVLVVYNIKIKNEGDIEGKVKEIVDYMPRDMVFSSDLNPTWMQDSNGNLYNRELKDIDIKPGETKEITLTLKKTMTENNVGLSHNVVELSKVENAANIKDKDSIPGNKVQGEDDMAETDVLISIRTGEEVAYVTLGIIVGIMITTGIYMIKRKVLNI